MKFLLENPASGYFPYRHAKPLLDDGRLSLVKGAPAFHYPAYVVYPEESDPEGMDQILKTLRVAARDTYQLDE